MNMTERLEELLEKKDGEISELKDQLEKYQQDAEAEWEWCHHYEVQESELPVPRLEIRWSALSEDLYLQCWDYCLIYRHLLGHLVAVPLGQTKTQGSTRPPIYDGKISTPFRDGVHICHDAGTLNLPAFAIVEEQIERIWMGDQKCQSEIWVRPEPEPQP